MARERRKRTCSVVAEALDPLKDTMKNLPELGPEDEPEYANPLFGEWEVTPIVNRLQRLGSRIME